MDDKRSLPVGKSSGGCSMLLDSYLDSLLADDVVGAVLEFPIRIWSSFSFAKWNSLFFRHNIVVRGDYSTSDEFSLSSDIIKLTLNYSAERQAHGKLVFYYAHIYIYLCFMQK